MLFERAYARGLAAGWRVQPGSLFDQKYYLARYPDVAASGMDPLFHFLRYGAAERRSPHPLFASDYYLRRYPDVARAGYNPLLHFLRFGGMEGRSPHPDFDSAFYLAGNPDVAAGRKNPLVHFVDHGAAELRRPHPNFDLAFYLASNPDIAAVQINPLVHFLEQGWAEGRRLRARARPNLPPENFLPVTGQTPGRAPHGAIDVIVPVYKGVAETQACIESVLSSSCAARVRVVAVNDCSPEPPLTEYLRRLSRAGRITLIENPRNLGFVRSVNAGMEAGDSDVILLNSDTLVFGDWADRLRDCAYAAERVGTVTPFTNNGTICSYPVFCAENRLPPSVDLGNMDAVFASVNRGRSVAIPTAVGFCMYIRRDCLNDTGLFDAKAFGIGYGEENDFSMRAAAKGWKNKLACDTFVYHAGSVSFGPASERQQAAMRTMISRHPAYTELVRCHVEEDPAKAFRIAVTAQRLRRSGRRVFLSVIHALGGGVSEHVRHLAALTSGDVAWVQLRPASPDGCILECTEEGYQFSLLLDPNREYETLETIIKACGVERIHVHHLLEHTSDLPRLLHSLNLPFDFTVHDYYTICPQVTLSDESGHYCGEPDETACNRCIGKRPPGNGLVDISSWRAAHAWTLLRANRVIAPSADTAARVARYFPEAQIVAAEHPGGDHCGLLRPRTVDAREPLRIAILGTQTTHKGLDLLRDCSELAQQRGFPLEFTLIGNVETGIPKFRRAFLETGRYDNAELPAILERTAPHVIWFPARIPETFSYTLSTCLEFGLPVAAHDIGAFPERLAGRPWSWILPPDTSAADWADFFLCLRQDHFLTGVAPVPRACRDRARADFYPAAYLSTPAPRRARAAPARPAGPQITVAAAVASHEGGQIQACGYVRVIQPLTHPAVADAVRLALRSPRDLAAAEADVVLVQRVAVRDMEIAERIVENCRRRGSSLVFETDDDLFDIPADHPESRHYLRMTESAKWLAGMADAVITSTAPLRDRMARFNANTIVLPNYLDDRLWLPPANPAPLSGERVRMLYAGTVSHREDLDFLGRAMGRLSRSCRSRIQMQVIGVTGQSGDWYEAVTVPGAVALSYPRFVEWIRGKNQWLWGVAPLLDTPFNRSKSALKFLEYSALGLASICSDVPVYREAVQPGETGVLAANDPGAWCAALEMAVGDQALWNRLHGNAQRNLAANTISARAAEIKAAWISLAVSPQNPSFSTKIPSFQG